VSHKGIRLLLEDTVKSLADNIQFDYGRTSDFNMLRDKKYPFISCTPFNTSASYTVNNVSNFSKVYQVQLAFYQLDKAESSQDEYVLILDEMNALADNYVNKLNAFAETRCLNSDDILITGISQQPFIKATADILTGYIMNFSITVTDNFDYCGIGC